MKKTFTLLVYTVNDVGLLNHVTIVFTRRKINIESLTTSESKVKGIHSYTIVVNATRESIEKVQKQLEKIVGVHKAFVYEDEDIIYQEIALYKLPISSINNGVKIEDIVRNHNARLLSVTSEFYIIEKTGHTEQTQQLMEQLKPHGLLQFIRSGRIAVAQPMKDLIIHLAEKEAAHDFMP